MENQHEEQCVEATQAESDKAIATAERDSERSGDSEDVVSVPQVSRPLAARDRAHLLIVGLRWRRLTTQRSA